MLFNNILHTMLLCSTQLMYIRTSSSLYQQFSPLAGLVHPGGLPHMLVARSVNYIVHIVCSTYIHST